MFAIVKTSLYIISFSFFLIVSNINTYADEKKPVNFREIEKELTWFIDRVKSDSIELPDHKIFIAKLYTNNEDCNYCLTIGYILNDFSLRNLRNFNYSLTIDNEVVILYIDKSLSGKVMFTNIQSLEPINMEAIQKKLSNEFVILGTTPGLVCCFKDDVVERTYFANSDDFPKNRNINYQEKGVLIKLDSIQTKEMINY
ncbi:MAG: hypothetical protein Q8O72_08345 [Bacteroidales bacterium]|nr:hypothetical protein [Bacteroidales bacterium]